MLANGIGVRLQLAIVTRSNQFKCTFMSPSFE